MTSKKKEYVPTSGELSTSYVLWDSGAAMSVTPFAKECHNLTRITDEIYILPIGGKKVPVTGRGIVNWNIKNQQGEIRVVSVVVLVVPSSPYRVLSQHQLTQQYSSECSLTTRPSPQVCEARIHEDKFNIHMIRQGTSFLPFLRKVNSSTNLSTIQRGGAFQTPKQQIISKFKTPAL